MVESSRASATFEAGRWSQRQTFAFVLASSVGLWTLVGFAVLAVL